MNYKSSHRHSTYKIPSGFIWANGMVTKRQLRRNCWWIRKEYQKFQMNLAADKYMKDNYNGLW